MPSRYLRSSVAGIALAGFGLGAGGAAAEVFVFADIFKDKDTFIFEDITKFKFVDIFVDVDLQAERVAKAAAWANQDNVFGFSFESGRESKDDILNSVNGNQGITSLNQAAGDFNNQGDVISFAEALDGSSAAYADAQASAEQLNLENEYETEPADDAFFGIGAGLNPNNFERSVERNANIVDSINENLGITTVNQSSGVFANQLNEVAVAVAGDFGVALSDASLGQFNSSNDVFQILTEHKVTMVNSVNNNSGVTAVNQTAGNMANQANVLAISAAGTF